MVGGLGNVLQKSLLDLGRLFRRKRSVWSNEQLDILSENVEDVEGMNNVR